MSDHEMPPTPDPDPVAELRARAEMLERRLASAEQDARARIVQAELKIEALRSGIVDLDGLKLLDPSEIEIGETGEVKNAGEIITQLRRAKPWLFGGGSSSSAANPPPAQPPRPKLATEMTDSEYRTARAAILRHQL
jgi:hypothetical protein